MSRASAAVLFPDGTLKYAIYDGTVDRLYPRLFTTIEAAWDAWAEREPMWAKEAPPKDSGEPVRIYENYGDGQEWKGTATREYVTSELAPWEIEDVIDCDSEPEWVRWE